MCVPYYFTQGKSDFSFVGWAAVGRRAEEYKQAIWKWRDESIWYEFHFVFVFHCFSLSLSLCFSIYLCLSSFRFFSSRHSCPPSFPSVSPSFLFTFLAGVTHALLANVSREGCVVDWNGDVHPIYLIFLSPMQTFRGASPCVFFAALRWVSGVMYSASNSVSGLGELEQKSASHGSQSEDIPVPFWPFPYWAIVRLKEIFDMRVFEVYAWKRD